MLIDETIIALARQNFAVFLRIVFSIINPGITYQHNWHIDAIAHALERVWKGDTKRLIITLPPRHLKSLITSVAFPAFLLGHDPTTRILCLSYAQDLATKFHNEFRQVIEHPVFQRIFEGARIGPWKDTGQEVILAGNGSRFAGSVGGTLTGRGGSLMIFDDPIKAQDAYSEVKRSGTNEWMSGTAMSRLDDKINGAVIIVMQRLHVDDPVGYMLERAPADWDVLDLPAIADTDRIIPTSWTESHTFRAGEALHAMREPLPVLERIRRDLGSEAFEAQYLQRPVPPGGNLLKREWLATFDVWPNPETATVMQSWDTASKAGLENDYSVCVTVAILYGCYHVIDVYRAKMDYPTLRAKAIELARRFGPMKILIEDAGIGPGLISDLVLEGLNAVGVVPLGSKADRVRVQSAKFEAGRVLFPAKATWLGDLTSELLAFPSGRFDDQVDALAQALSFEPDDPVRILLYDHNLRLVCSV